MEGWTVDDLNFHTSNRANRECANHGSCCAELDVWNGNIASSSFQAMPCDVPSQTLCIEDACGGPDSAELYAGSNRELLFPMPCRILMEWKATF